jgi:hypothetical protein
MDASYLVTISTAVQDEDLMEKVPTIIRNRFEGTAVTVKSVVASPSEPNIGRYAKSLVAAWNMYQMSLNSEKMTKKQQQLLLERFRGMCLAGSSLGLAMTDFAIEMQVRDAFHDQQFATGRRPAFNASKNTAQQEWDNQVIIRVTQSLRGN